MGNLLNFHSVTKLYKYITELSGFQILVNVCVMNAHILRDGGILPGRKMYQFGRNLGCVGRELSGVGR